MVTPLEPSQIGNFWLCVKWVLVYMTLYLCIFICNIFLALCDVAKAYCLVIGNSFYLMTAPDCSNGCREATTITEGISEQCWGGRRGYHATEEGAGSGNYNQVNWTMFIRTGRRSAAEKVSALPYYIIFTNSTHGTGLYLTYVSQVCLLYVLLQVHSQCNTDNGCKQVLFFNVRDL